jgi:hypothetical protein
VLTTLPCRDGDLIAEPQGGNVSATTSVTATPPRPGLAGRSDRLLVALLDHRTAVWTDDVDANTQRERNREWIRAVEHVKARRRLRRLGAVRSVAARRMS